MSSAHPKPEYHGIHKYPGVIATVVATAIGLGFILMVYRSGHGAHHDGAAHHGSGAASAAPAAGKAEAKH